MRKTFFISALILLIGCQGPKETEEFKNTSDFYPVNSSLWIAEKVVGEPEPEFRTFFYFVNDTLFMELYQFDFDKKTTEKYFSFMSNNLTAQAYFIKSEDHFIMGNNTWSWEVSAEFESKNDKKFNLYVQNINSPNPKNYEYHLREVEPKDSIDFEFKEHYQQELESFWNDTLVSYNLKSGVPNIKFILQGNLIEEHKLIRTETYSVENNRRFGIYQSIDSDLKFRLEDIYFEDSLRSSSDKFKNVVYQE